MHNQFDVTWLRRYCAGTYARFIAEGSNALKTGYWGLGFGGRIDSRLRSLIFQRTTPRFVAVPALGSLIEELQRVSLYARWSASQPSQFYRNITYSFRANRSGFNALLSSTEYCFSWTSVAACCAYARWQSVWLRSSIWSYLLIRLIWKYHIKNDNLAGK
jgi:hypothetical protein